MPGQRLSAAGGRFRVSVPASPLVALIAAAAWTTLVRLPLLQRHGADDAFYTEVALLWRQGVLPYVGAFDIKPPGIFAVLAVAQALLKSNLAALNAVSIASDALTAGLVMILGRRYGQPIVGVAAAAMYPILSETVVFDPAYSLLAAVTTLAVFVALTAKTLLARATLAGLTIGAACAIKHTAAFEGLAILAILMGAEDAAGRRIRASVAFVLAAAVVPGAVLGYFAAHHAAGAMLWDVVGVAAQRFAARPEKTTLLEGPWRLVILTVALAPVFVAVFMVGNRLELAGSRAPSWALRLWLAMALASALAQRALLPTYVGPVLAPGLVLAGLVVAGRSRPDRPLWLAARLAGISLALLAYIAAERAETLLATDDMPAIESVAAAIRAARPTSEDRLYVVLKSEWLYSITGLRPPTQYFLPSQSLCPFADVGPARLGEAFAIRPRFVVVGDPGEGWDCEPPGARREMNAALARDYHRIAQIKGAIDAYELYEAGATPPALR